MCGILTAINKKIDPTDFKNMLSCMKHRGPDASGIFEHAGNQLGHNRLSIIDLDARSNQPFSQGPYQLVFNGEIYNYKELIQEHSLEMRTTSDTEVVIKMYEKYREKCLNYFNGMFAIIIYAHTPDLGRGRQQSQRSCGGAS